MRDIHQITTAIASATAGAVASEAFGELYDAKFDFLFTLVKRRVGVDESTALDIVQDSMIRVIRHMKPMRTEDELNAWLTRVALNCAYDHLRSARRRRYREAQPSLPESVIGDHPALIDDQLKSLRRELAELESGAFDLVVMRFHAGMTLEAIGRRFGVGPGAADGRIRRALAKLKAGMEDRHDAAK